VSRRKSERLMNLVIALLVTRQYLTKERIRTVVEGYHRQSDEAFERMFERDKEELREIGIEIEVGNFEELFDDEPGYRIRRDAFELPEIHLEPDEAAVVGLAARVWQHARLADQTSSALVKLRAAGVEVEPDALSLVEPRLSAGEAAFEPFWSAVLTRTPVTFGYSRAGESPQERRFEPWGLLSWHGRWYAVGHDRDRHATRMFRISRVRGLVHPDGAAGQYTVPADLDLRAEAQALMPGPPESSATLRVRAGTGHALRRRATSVSPAGDGYDWIELPFGSRWQTAEEIAGYAADVVVEGPPELRDAVVRVLRGAAGLDRQGAGAA
jgi:proteasome accessory factor B